MYILCKKATATVAFVCSMLLGTVVRAQLTYTLDYSSEQKGIINITIALDEEIEGPIDFVMPRYIPGRYTLVNYDQFIIGLVGLDAEGNPVEASQNPIYNAPRWTLGSDKSRIRQITYQVDLLEMEERLQEAPDASKARNGYVGLLNYSVFGYLEGMQDQEIKVTFNAPTDWRVFSTIYPDDTPAKDKLEITALNHAVLADGQTMMGTDFQVKRFHAEVPLYVAVYSETDYDMDKIGELATESLSLVKDYFGMLPFDHYSYYLEYVEPIPGHFYGPLMEHLNSTTGIGDTSMAITGDITPTLVGRRMFSMVHHMAHAIIPLRCYGDNYRPYIRELPVPINNIWFNEGLPWYISYDLLKSDWVYDIISKEPYRTSSQLKQLSLVELSQLGSTVYSSDFRIGLSISSRGALMAEEMDKYIQQQTDGEQSLRQVVRYLHSWVEKEGRGFTMTEFPDLLNASTGLDLSEIYERWMQPLEN